MPPFARKSLARCSDRAAASHAAFTDQLQDRRKILEIAHVGFFRIDPRNACAKNSPTAFPYRRLAEFTVSAQLANVVALPIPERSSRGLVLHVEDDEALRRSTAMLLRGDGFETREASNGEEALAQAESLRGRLDVLIVDYNLGYSLSGTEVAEEIARLLGHAVPTVILTGDPANAEVPWLTNAPVWLARKPLLPETLLAALPPLVAFRRAVAAVEPPR
jgi:CheY-like chemotaxis protein